MRFIILFAVTVFCMLVIVIKSSGISQFDADRDVSMQIADEENAFITLPESIILNINVTKLSTDYYTKEMILNRTEESTTITDVDHNLVIKNNMAQPIYLEQIQIDNFHLQFDNGGVLLGIGENTKVDLTESLDEIDSIILDNLHTESNATFYFRWDTGNITVQKHVIINMAIEEKTEDKIEI
ncbi:hypothetical protein [Bacillus sp. JJ1566]|uniref:hypothetical protein n=1 Tax=Bacillus sp. JJ1566 TaxID=3122961 RepID=UPI002FFF74A2